MAFVQFCNNQDPNVTFTDPMFVATSQSIDPEAFTIQAVTVAAASVAGQDAITDASIRISPNPASDEIGIQITVVNAGALDVSLYDATGHFIKQIFSGRKEAGVYTMPFDARQLSSGAYFIAAKINGNLVQSKLNVVK